MSIRSGGQAGLIALAIVGSALAPFGPAAHAAGSPPTVSHDEVETVHYDDDICGPRENDTTYTRKVVVESFADSGNGRIRYKYVARVDYVSDFVDPGIPDVEGSLTEVFTFNLTLGGVAVATGTFHDYLGDDIRIYERFHLTEVDGRLVVERSIAGVEGCP